MLQSHQISTLASTLAANVSHNQGATDICIYLQKSHEEQIIFDRQQSHSFGQIAANSQNDTHSIVSVEAQIQQQLREIQATLSNVLLLTQKQQQLTKNHPQSTYKYVNKQSYKTGSGSTL